MVASEREKPFFAVVGERKPVFRREVQGVFVVGIAHKHESVLEFACEESRAMMRVFYCGAVRIRPYGRGMRGLVVGFAVSISRLVSICSFVLVGLRRLERLVRGLDAFGGSLAHPRHQFAQSLAHFFNLVFFAGLEERVVFFVARLIFSNPIFGKFAGLNVFEGGLHAFLDARVDDFRTNGDVAPLGGFRDGEAHAVNAGLVDEIHNELEFVQALEVSHFGLVARFHQHFVPCLNQCGGAAAENRLLAEQVRFRFLAEGGLDDAGASAANSLRPSKGDLLCPATGVLMNGDQRGNPLSFRVLSPNNMPGTFGRY